MRIKLGRLRFGVGTLLFLMACTAGYLTGFRWGVSEKQLQVRRDTIATTVYSVGDLLSQNKEQFLADFDSLIDLISSTVSSHVWIENGGDIGEIRPLPSTKSLVVTCDLETHDQLAELLQQLRDQAYRLDEEELMKTVREVKAQKPIAPCVVEFSALYTEFSHSLMVGHFESGLQTMTRRIGEPSEVYTTDSKEFPTWIVAQRVAVWNQENAQLYYALVDSRYDGELIVVGWRPEGLARVEPVELHTDLDIPFRAGPWEGQPIAGSAERREEPALRLQDESPQQP